MVYFNKKYFVLSLLLLLIEILIGVFAHDRIIRPYGGDFLVVIFLYCLVKSFLHLSVRTTALSVLLLSYIVETSQYFHVVDLLGLKKSGIAAIILENYFAWTDMLAYTLGILLVNWLEHLGLGRRSRLLSSSPTKRRLSEV